MQSASEIVTLMAKASMSHRDIWVRVEIEDTRSEQVTARTNPGPEERRFGYVSDGHSCLLGSSALREERERAKERE